MPLASFLGGGFLSAPANTVDQAASSAKEAKAIEVGTAAPDAGLRDLDGNDVTLHAIVAGKPTVLIFYRGSWCPYCNLHLSDLVTVEEELRSLGYQIVAISPDRPEELNKMTAADHLNYRLFSDPQAEAMKKFGVAYQVDNTTLTNYKQKFNVDLESSSGQIDREIPLSQHIHIILDNYSTHKHPVIKRWLARHPRFELHFTPTGSSWMNLIERFFRDLSQQAILPGSVRQLVDAIMQYLTQHNLNPKRYVWRAKGEEILAKIQRAWKAALDEKIKMSLLFQRQLTS